MNQIFLLWNIYNWNICDLSQLKEIQFFLIKVVKKKDGYSIIRFTVSEAKYIEQSTLK